jgi:hypothetical protein
MATAMASRHLGHRSATTASLPARMNDGSYRCTACQRRTGTAFHFGASFPKEQVRLDGERKVYERDADSGYRIRFHFCPNCGTTLYWEGDRNPAVCGVAVGAFDLDFPAAQRLDLGGVDASMARAAAEYGTLSAGPTTSHLNCVERSIRERRRKIVPITGVS